MLMQTIEDSASYSNNNVLTSSLWGVLSSKVFMTNSLKDRKYLSELWKIGLEVIREAHKSSTHSPVHIQII
jgi:hypothetical protein